MTANRLLIRVFYREIRPGYAIYRVIIRRAGELVCDIDGVPTWEAVIGTIDHQSKSKATP